MGGSFNDMNTSSIPLTARGYELDSGPESFGELRRSDVVNEDPQILRERFAEEGYLYAPGFFDPKDILEVRGEFVRRLREAGSLNPDFPIEEAIAGENASHTTRELSRDNAPLRRVLFSGHLIRFYESFFGTSVRHFDHIWTRCVPPGQGTQPHADLVYMSRGTQNLMTAWIPFGDVPLELGGLMMLEKSHLQAERLRNYLETDVDTYCANRGPYKFKNGYLSSNPVSLREKLGGRWLTAEFRAGDLLTFGMKMVHASLDNHTKAYRMSTDTRYQSASEPIDPRWVGPDTEEYGERNRIGKIC